METLLRRNRLPVVGACLVSGMLSLGLSGCSLFQQGGVADHELIALEDNQEVVSGELANGFAYHIDTWAQGSPTVELRLRVDFGSLDEADDERGYAHFIEHMAFNGTENYPGQTLTDYLKSTGMDFGGDINAYTSFDETVYTLSVPSDQPELVREAFDVMAEWAARIEFDPAEVEAEKGVIVEEWRLNYAGDSPVWLQQLQSRYQGTPYGSRLPIGTAESIRSATAEKLESLYRRYYQADRMTLYVSGLAETLRAHDYIDKAFGELRTGSGPELNRPTVDYAPLDVAVMSDQTTSQGFVEQGYIFRPQPLNTVEGQQQELYSELLLKALEERAEQWRIANPGRLDLGVYGYELDDGAFAIDLTSYSQGQLSQGDVFAMQQVWQQLVQHGISAQEYGLYGERMLNGMRYQFETFDNLSAAERLDLIQSFASSGITLVDWDDYLWAAETLKDHYNHQSFNQWLGELGESPSFAYVVVPQSQLSQWAPSELRAELLAREKLDVPPMALNFENAGQTQLNTRMGEVLKVAETEAPNLKRMELSNGLTVWFYPSDVESNRVVVNLVSRGGLAVNSRQDATLKLFWASILTDTSLLGMNNTQFSDWQNTQGISGGAYAFVDSSGLYWEGKPTSLETMLAITAHQMQPMDLDGDLVQEYVEGTRSYLQEYWTTPDGIKERALLPLEVRHPGLATVDEADLEWITPAALNQFQRHWLSLGTDLELFVLGNISESELTEALEATIAGVPLPEMTEGGLDLNSWQGTRRLEIPAHSEDRTDIEIRIRLEEPVWDQNRRDDLGTAAGMLEEHLMAVVREQQGDSYDVWAYIDQAEPELPATYLMMGTSTGPERAEAVIRTLIQALEQPSDWITEAALQTQINQRLEIVRKSHQSLDSLLEDMEFYTRSDRSLADWKGYEASIRNLNTERVAALLEQFAEAPNRLTITVVPQQ